MVNVSIKHGTWRFALVIVLDEKVDSCFREKRRVERWQHLRRNGREAAKQAYKHKWKAVKAHFSARHLPLQFVLWCIPATNTSCINARAFRHYHQTYGPAYQLYFCSLSEPELRSRSRGRSWSRSESTVSTRIRVGAGVSKILPTPTPVRSCRITTVNRHWLWPNGSASFRKHLKEKRRLAEWR